MDEERRVLLERADTAFVGSLHPARGVDASHRGGAPGFIQVVDATTLRVPDYPGNSMFMTLGNFEVDSRASLAVLDFEARPGRLLFWLRTPPLRREDDPQHPTGGTGRYWDLPMREWVQFELPCAAALGAARSVTLQSATVAGVMIRSRADARASPDQA